LEQVCIFRRESLGGVQDEADDVGAPHGGLGGVVGGGSK
jgi:hypothetical protein